MAIVAATFVPNTRKAMKLNAAAHTTARPGVEHPGGDDGGDRVGGVVEAVDEVEAERDRDDDDQEEVLHAVLGQLCLAAMEATMSLIFSKELRALSNASTTSFQRSTVNALNSPEKRRASVRR